METPPSRCETKEEQPIAWCHSSNRLNKEGNYAVAQLDAEFCSDALSTTTITLMDGWTTAHTEKLRAAVKDVVAANPILSGKLVSGEGGKGFAIAPAEHKNLDPATLNVVAGPSDFEPPADIVARCSYCQDILGPLVPSLGSPMQQKKFGGPLFNVTLIELPGNRAAYSVSLSHIVGDGWTYYALIDQLDCLVNGRPLEPLVWDDLGISLRSIQFDSSWSNRDKFLIMMIPSQILKVLYNMVFGKRQHSHILEVNGDSMAMLKESSRGTAAFVSTNDIVTAAIYEVMRDDIAHLCCDLRNSKFQFGIPPRIGGNFVGAFVQPRGLAAGSPDFIRKQVMHPPGRNIFGKNKVPLWLAMRGDFGVITNWASQTKFITAPCATVSCHVPHQDLFEFSPILNLLQFTYVVVFRADPTTIACLHNVLPADLKARARSANLFKKVFKLPAN